MTKSWRATVSASALAASLLLVAVRPAVAQDAPAPVASIEARPATATDAPDASAERPAWLSQRRQASFTRPSDGGASPWAVVGVFLLLLVGGGVALRSVARRGSAPALGKLRVLASAKLGPRAHLVSVEVEGRVLVLGVTEQRVQVLARARRAPAPEPEPAPAGGARSVVLPARSAASPFSRLLDDVLARPARALETEAAPAVHVAEATQDKVELSRRPAPVVDVDGQLDGLLRRLEGRR